MSDANSAAKCYPTGWVGLWHRDEGTPSSPNQWRFVRAETRQSIGPLYHSKRELLASARPFALTNGYRVKEECDVNAEASPLPPQSRIPLRVLKIGTTADAFFQVYWRSFLHTNPHMNAVEAEEMRRIIRGAFLFGFASMNDIVHRVGESDVDETRGMEWITALRLECCRELGLNPNA